MKYRLLLLLLVSCGDSSIPTDPTPVNPDALVEALVVSHCERVISCCDTSELDIVFVGEEISSGAECEALLRGQLNAFYKPAVEDAQKRKTVNLVAEKIASCESALKSQSCDEFIPGNPTEIQAVCDAAFQPLLETSGFCKNDFECKSHFCSASNGAEGSCKIAPLTGAPCENGRCEIGLFCDPITELCADKRDDEAGCEQNDQCKSDRCEIEGATGTCIAIPELCDG